MPAQIVTEDHIEYARILRQKGKSIAEIAKEMNLNASTLRSGLNRKTVPGKVDTMLKRNQTRQLLVDKLWESLSIGREMKFRDSRKHVSGEVFYLDEHKVGVINKRGWKEFVTINDLVPINARMEVCG